MADLAQYYGLIVSPALADPPDPLTLATLWVQLPEQSRCVRKHNPDAEWTDSERLLHSIEYTLRLILWQKTKDGQKGRDQPKPLKTPGEIRRAKQAADNALANKAEIDAILGIKPD